MAPYVFAQALPDPTRPPSALNTVQEADAVASEAGPALQSVILSSDRKIAIINGQAVKQGDKYGEARVIKITETEVVLRNGNEMQTLKLFPSIEKKRTEIRNTPAKNDSGRQ